MGWLRKSANDGVAVTRDLRSGLGRISFSAALYRYLLPFLGPLYAWISVSAEGAAWPLPPALIIIMRWIADQIERRPQVTLRHPAPQGLGKFFKADARAEGETVQIGGYEVLPDADLFSCRWFSFVLTPSSTPWAFVKHNQAYRTIASLELYATLLCIVLFIEPCSVARNTSLYFTGVTDNQGNKSLIHKSMTSKFPLYIVLLELTEQLQARNLLLDLRWQPRESNQSADNLSNGLFQDFDPKLRVDPDLTKLGWLVMPKLLTDALDLEQLIQVRKVQRRDLVLEGFNKQPLRKGKKRKAKGLRETDPW